MITNADFKKWKKRFISISSKGYSNLGYDPSSSFYLKTRRERQINNGKLFRALTRAKKSYPILFEHYPKLELDLKEFTPDANTKSILTKASTAGRKRHFHHIQSAEIYAVMTKLDSKEKKLWLNSFLEENGEFHQWIKANFYDPHPSLPNTSDSNKSYIWWKHLKSKARETIELDFLKNPVALQLSATFKITPKKMFSCYLEFLERVLLLNCPPSFFEIIDNGDLSYENEMEDYYIVQFSHAIIKKEYGSKIKVYTTKSKRPKLR